MTSDDSTRDQRGASERTTVDFERREFVGALAALAAAGSATGTASAQSDVDQRVDELVSRMSLSEKVHLTHGDPGHHTGHISGLDQYGIPDIDMLDGPVGVRTEDEQPATAFPASIAAAASFDPDLMYEQGRAMAREAKSFGVEVLLGPALNIHRVPVGGRTFEYYSEDPYLTGEMATASTEGIQDEDVVATPKHFVANSFETNRENVSAEVSERALREIYLPGFKKAVQEGNAWSVMSAYNAVNGTNCSANEFLLRQVLREEWGFDGYVVSDWDAIQDSVAAANGGLDLDMPGYNPDWGQDYFNADLQPAVESGQVPESRVDEMARNVLRPFAATGHLDGSIGSGERNTTEHQELSREFAEAGATLLKNEGDVLPIDTDEVDSIAVVGEGIDEPVVGGGGAAEVVPPEADDPLSAIRDHVGGDVEVLTARNSWEAGQVAGDADVAIAFGHVDSSEFEDRDDMRLQRGDEAIQGAADANPNTVAVLRIPGPVTMPWVDDVAGILTTWYPGMRDGVATANLLFGETNPSGKLPTTFAESFEDYPVSERRRFPGEGGQAHYEEGIFVGYRHFDAEGIEPLFPFGHGLSYTTFEYTDVSVGPVADDAMAAVSVEVTNTGDRRGGEVVQVYVEQVDPSVPRPPKELRGFGKVWLDPGESDYVTVSLDAEDFQYWDPDAGEWTLEDGEYRIHVAASSRDVRATRTFTVGDEPDRPVLGDSAGPVQDLDSDGRYEDVNGNDRADYDDAVTLFQHRNDDAVQSNVEMFDFNGNERIDIDDAVTLFQSQ